jgi:hypothetical protein
MKPLADAEAVFGAVVSRVAAATAALGMVVAVLGAVWAPDATAGALAACFLFAGGATAGGVALSAAIRVSGGRWAGRVLPIADATAGFFLPASLLFLASAWLGRVPPGRALIELLATLGLGFLAGRHASTAPRLVPSVGYLIAYAIVLSVWAGELIMVRSRWDSSVLPAYYFVGAFLSALAFVAFVTAVRPSSDPGARHDLGKLLFAFLVFWTYLVWSAFLPTWYANIPEETRPLVLRWAGPWRVLAAAVIGAVFGWPFWLLLPEAAKRRGGTLALGSALIFIGLFGERFLLVLPGGPVEARGPGAVVVALGIAAGALGSFVLSVGARLARLEAARGGEP